MNGFFKGKAYGAATIGERGQFVIPSELRKELKIKPGDRIMVFAKPDKHMISLIKEEDFSAFLNKAAKIISKLERRVNKNGK